MTTKQRIITSPKAFHEVMNEHTVAVFEHGEKYHESRLSVIKVRMHVCRVDPWPEYVGRLEKPETDEVIDDSHWLNKDTIKEAFETHGVARVYHVDEIEDGTIKQWVDEQNKE